jgi:hypothetical protein
VGAKLAEIKKEIEVARARLGADLDLLQDKISTPKRAQRAAGSLERRVSEVADSLRPKVEAAAQKAKMTAGQTTAPVRRQLDAHPRVAETVHRTADGAGTAASAVRARAGRNPWAAGAVVGGTTLAMATVTAVVLVRRRRTNKHTQSDT